MSASSDPAPPGPAETEALSLKSPPWRFPRWGLAVLALGVMWLTIFIAWPIGMLIATPVILLLLRQRRRLGLLCLLGSPYVVLTGLSLLLGVVSYFGGAAQLRTIGMPSREFHNLDERWRVYRSTSGCIVDGSEIFTHEPNNAVVKLLVSVLGPMRGAYTGPYPQHPEVAARLRDAAAVPRAALQSGTVALAEKTVRLEPPTVAELARLFPEGDLAAVFFGPHSELLLVTGKSARSEINAALIDSGRGRSFATYYDLGAAAR